MKLGNNVACDLVGFPESHGEAFQDVSDQIMTIILSRDLGNVCTLLVEEHYAMKGFRIHGKSCDWGPMAGFVCMDPRLRKSPGEKAKIFQINQHWDALTGKISKGYGGFDPEHKGLVTKVKDKGPFLHQKWKAGVMPLVISDRRKKWLEDNKLIKYSDKRKLRGTSRNGPVGLPWRLIVIDPGDLIDLKLVPGDEKDFGPRYGEDTYYGIFIDKKFPAKFKQMPIAGMKKPQYQGHEWLLGMINPDTGDQGFKACVTGDYDLFSVWPLKADVEKKQARMFASDGKKRHAAILPVGEDKRWTKMAKGKEHFWMGNINQRLQMVAHSLNDALRIKGGYLGGNAVFHSDEAGNPVKDLQKKLEDSFPVIVFVPNGSLARRYDPVIALETVAEFRELIGEAEKEGYHVELRKDWKMQIWSPKFKPKTGPPTWRCPKCHKFFKGGKEHKC